MCWWLATSRAGRGSVLQDPDQDGRQAVRRPLEEARQGEEGVTLSTTLQSIIEEFSAEDQKLIQSKASILAEEMVRHADSLAEARSALVKTQEEVARVLNVKQNAVAQLERRSDLLLSTLRASTWKPWAENWPWLSEQALAP
jgi:hypothetical protein